MTLTSHGHHIPGTPTIDEKPFPNKARCGGPSLCKDCMRASAKARPLKNDPVNHPAHYTAYPNVEVIEITAQMNFCIGNAVKYLARAQFKGKEEEDIQKALWCIRHELDELNSVEDWGDFDLVAVRNAEKLYAHLPFCLGRAVRALCEKAPSVQEYRSLLNAAIDNIEAHIELQPYSQKD